MLVLLVIRIIILTFVVGIPDICFINLNLLVVITVADINVVDLIDFSGVGLLFCEYSWFKVDSSLEGCLKIVW